MASMLFALCSPDHVQSTRDQREPIKQMPSMAPQDPRVGPEQTLVPPTTRAPEETRENHDSPPEKNRPTRHAVLPGPDTIASGNPLPSVPPHRRCCLLPPQGKYLQSKRRRHELFSRHFPCTSSLAPDPAQRPRTLEQRAIADAPWLPGRPSHDLVRGAAVVSAPTTTTTEPARPLGSLITAA